MGNLICKQFFNKLILRCATALFNTIIHRNPSSKKQSPGFQGEGRLEQQLMWQVNRCVVVKANGWIKTVLANSSLWIFVGLFTLRSVCNTTWTPGLVPLEQQTSSSGSYLHGGDHKVRSNYWELALHNKRTQQGKAPVESPGESLPKPVYMLPRSTVFKFTFWELGALEVSCRWGTLRIQ